MPNSYSNEAARAAGPDIDDSVPAWAYERIEALESLARTLYHAAANGRPLSTALARHASDMLDLDPPGSNPATEG